MKWFHNLLHKNVTHEKKTLPIQAQRWNRFIEEVCFSKQADLSLCQKAAVLSFRYDSEMNSGGHSGYFDCYPEVSSDDLIWALCEVGGKAYAKNYKEAIRHGQDDDYEKTDSVFYKTIPILTELIMEYVENHYGELLDNT